MLLDGRVAVVTGSGAGMGRAFALALAAAGAKVVVNARTASKVAGVVEEIRKAGGEAEGCVVSVETMDGARRIIGTAIEKFGRLDILVNNAGMNIIRPLLEMEEKDFDQVIATDLKGVFACTWHAARHMAAQRWGRIITIGSGAARGLENRCGYAAAKGGVMAMTASWAQELAPYGITCNVLRAAVRTESTAKRVEEARQAAVKRGEKPPTAFDLGFFEADSIAALVVYLASDHAQGVTGQFLAVDGPRLAQWNMPGPVAHVFMPDGWTAQRLIEHFPATLGRQPQSYGFRDSTGKRVI